MADGSCFIPADWQALAHTVLAPAEFLQFKTWWADHAETLAAHNQAGGLPIFFDQLMGLGNWGRVADQLPMDDRAVEQVRGCCLRAWEIIAAKGRISTSFQKITQGPKEPYTEFIARLQESIRK